MKKQIAVLVAVMLGSAALLAQSADELQKALAREATTLEAWAKDKTIVDAVRAQNGKNVPLAETQRLDEQWQAGKAAALVKQMTTGACADQLRKLVATDARYSETFVMDAHGALVCASQATSDYWQGDEPKWTKTFNERKAFIDRPRLDDSAQSRLAQISLPIVDGDKTIGVITVGLSIEKLKK
jgi:hypothetical protein